MDVPQPTPRHDSPQPAFQPRDLLIRENVLGDYQICPWAWSLIGNDPNSGHLILQAVSCGTWPCPVCSRSKIRRLADACVHAAPNRLLTLTVDPKLHSTPRIAFDATSKQVPELIRRLRLKFPPVEYLRVTELHKSGYPHYHLMVRSPYLPHPVIKAAWIDLTGAEIVNVRQVKDSFRAYYYLAKYLSKLHSIEWTERHVSYSRDFFMPGWNSKPQGESLVNKARDARHPHQYLCENFYDATVTQLSPYRWDINDIYQSPAHNVELLGARPRLPPRLVHSLQQRPETADPRHRASTAKRTGVLMFTVLQIGPHLWSCGYNDANDDRHQVSTHHNQQLAIDHARRLNSPLTADAYRAILNAGLTHLLDEGFILYSRSFR